MKNIIELATDLFSVQLAVSESHDDFSELYDYGDEDIYDPSADMPLLQQEQSILAALRDETRANEEALAYEREEARLLGIRVRM